MKMKTDEEIIKSAIKGTSLDDILRDAISQARESEREKVAEQIAILNARIKELKRDKGCPNCGYKSDGSIGSCGKCEWCLTYSDWAEDQLEHCVSGRSDRKSCIFSELDTEKWCYECKKYLGKKQIPQIESGNREAKK